MRGRSDIALVSSYHIVDLSQVLLLDVPFDGGFVLSFPLCALCVGFRRYPESKRVLEFLFRLIWAGSMAFDLLGGYASKRESVNFGSGFVRGLRAQKRTNAGPNPPLKKGKRNRRLPTWGKFGGAMCPPVMPRFLKTKTENYGRAQKTFPAPHPPPERSGAGIPSGGETPPSGVVGVTFLTEICPIARN